MVNDKPIVNLTFAQLDAEESPEPFVYVTKANKRITFPDIFNMEADEGAAFLLDIQTSRDDGAVLRKWLPEDDVKAIGEDHLTLRKRMRLMQTVLAYYEGSLGTPGEGVASSSS